jgi:hypothetical protein
MSDDDEPTPATRDDIVGSADEADDDEFDDVDDDDSEDVEDANVEEAE